MARSGRRMCPFMSRGESRVFCPESEDCMAWDGEFEDCVILSYCASNIFYEEEEEEED